MRQAGLLSPRAATGRDPRGGRSARPGRMPSFWCPSQSQTPSPILGLETAFMASEQQPAGTHAPEVFPTDPFPRKGGFGVTLGYLLTRTAHRGEDAPLSMARHL